MNNLGDYFHEQRIGLGLSLGQVARMVGRQNISKAANQICLFERDGNITEDLLAALANALGIDIPTVQNLIEQDRQAHLKAFEAWASEPVPM
jgi:transcriptional regulator with XRE-family HTH domain